MNIELEDTKQLREWLQAFIDLADDDRITLPNIPYNFYEIQRELTRRNNLDL